MLPIYLVAGVVGEVAARIFGYSDPQTLPYAHHLGRALQLTNIIRDIGDDARRGRKNVLHRWLCALKKHRLL